MSWDSSSLADKLGLNEHQKQALLMTDSGIIAAGAGAGKTQTLAALVARDLLVDKVSPGKVAVVTFTKAAAANLITRVAGHLATLDGNDAVTDGLYVSTIDALWARLLRENALDADVMPGFSVGEPRTVYPLRVHAWQQVLQEADTADLVALAGVIEPYDETLFSEIDKAHESLRLHGIDPESAPDALEMGPTENDKETLLSKMSSILNHSDATGKKLQASLSSDVQAIASDDITALSTLKYGPIKESIASDVAAVIEDITRYKQLLANVETFPYRQKLVAFLRRYSVHYHAAKQAEELLDFTDLSVMTSKYLDKGVFSGFERLYIDEAQDTNPLQLSLLKKATSPSGRMLVVGDALQSLYSFRGADVEGFRRQAASAKQSVQLLSNYRSQKPLMDTINAMCSRVPELTGDLIAMQAQAKPVTPSLSPAVELIRVLDEEVTPSSSQEALLVCQHVVETRDKLKMTNSDICILCPTNSEGEAYADALRSLGVPTLLIQSRGLFSRQECLDLLAYLRLLADEHDESALLRVLSSPFVGLDDVQIHALLSSRGTAVNAEGYEQHIPMFEHMKTALPDFALAVQEHQRLVGQLTVRLLAERVCDDLSYLLALDIADHTGALRRNVEKLILALHRQQKQDGLALSALLDVLQEQEAVGLDEGQDSSIPEGVQAARVMTIHQSKGDEFPLTVVARLSKQSRPETDRVWADSSGNLGFTIKDIGSDEIAQKAKDERKAVSDEEKRRLFYVAITRAERHLIIAASAKLKKDGSASWRGSAKWLFGEGGAIPELDALEDDTDVVVKGAPVETSSMTPIPGMVRSIVFNLPEEDIQNVQPAASSSPASHAEVPREYSPQSLPIYEGALSYSQLASWRKCTLRRHLEITLTKRSDKSSEEPTHVIGEDEEVFSSHNREFGQKLHVLLQDIDWSKGFDEEVLLKEHDFGADMKRARQALLALKGSDISKELSTTQAVNEQSFVMQMGQHTLVGRFDVYGCKDNHAQVIDWKTGDEDDAAFSEDYRLQRMMYALAALSSPDKPDSVKSVSVYLPSLHQEAEVFTRDDLPALTQSLITLIADIELADVKAASAVKQPFCHGCPGLTVSCPVSF